MHRHLTEEPRYSRCVPMVEIEENTLDLSISRYARPATAEEEIELAAVNAKLASLDEKTAAATKEHNPLRANLDYPCSRERRVPGSRVRSNFW